MVKDSVLMARISTRAHNVSSKTGRKNIQCRKLTLLEAKLEYFHRFELPECSPIFMSAFGAILHASR
jgi:hypothetical protein